MRVGSTRACNRWAGLARSSDTAQHADYALRYVGLCGRGNDSPQLMRKSLGRHY